MNFYDKPVACEPYKSYRYRGGYGWIMIGAIDDDEALREARRSTDGVVVSNLQRWNGTEYEPVSVT